MLFFQVREIPERDFGSMQAEGGCQHKGGNTESLLLYELEAAGSALKLRQERDTASSPPEERLLLLKCMTSHLYY